MSRGDAARLRRRFSTRARRWRRGVAATPRLVSTDVSVSTRARSQVYSCGVVLLVLTNGMLSAHEVRCLHGEGLDAALELRRMTQPQAARPSGELLELLGGLLAAEDDRLAAAAALKKPWLTAASGDRTLSNPSAAVLALRALDRAAKSLVALLDDGPRDALKTKLDATSGLGLPPRCVLLGDVVRGLAADDESSAAATLRALHPDPDIVLVHKPFALEAAYARERTTRAEKKREADARRRKSEPAAPMTSAKSDPDLRRHASAASVGRLNAPGAGASTASMDGTFYEITSEQMDGSKASVGMRLDGSLDGSGTGLDESRGY
mmetsp:Transcript_18020/g.56270  ORF Transcript_18020/g.56270 Transcript_18020/m.56270 type:complete len:322 (+) Transcript_18020:1093-2058(+)